MDTLRKKEKAEFLKLLTPVVGRAVERFASEERWTDVEISKETGVLPNRLAEYKNFSKYGRAISEKHLLAFILKGIVNVEELKKEARTSQEKNFLDAIGSIESESLRLKILEVQRAGIDLEKLLDDALKGK